MKGLEDRLIINYENILEYVRIPMEYLFIDKVEVVPGQHASGIKLASTLDWYFKMHFPGNPVMPGIFIMEAISQTGACIISTMPDKRDILLLFNGCKNVRFYRSVRPGDVLKTEVKLKTYRCGMAVFESAAYVEAKKICNMDFSLTAPSELANIGKNK